MFGKLVRRSPIGTVLRAEVKEDLGRRTARAGFAHLPEIVFIEPLYSVSGHTDDICPDSLGLIVSDMTSHPQAVPVYAKYLGHELPGPRDCLILEVVTETEISEHLEERKVPGRATNCIKVVVLATCSHAFLNGDGTGRIVRGCLLAQEVRDKGHHP